MLDISSHTLPPAEWQDRATAALHPGYRGIARALSAGKALRALDFHPIKENTDSLTLRVDAGDRTGILKLFDGPDGVAQYDREKQVLLAMTGTGLTPRPLAFSDACCFVLMQDAGTALNRADINRIGAETLAHRIGAWTAGFESRAPARATTGNWFGYLSKYGADLGINKLDTAWAVLSDIPLCGEVIARNDPALHNFLLTPDDALLGCDFAKVCFRPRGWDYLMTFHALIQWFPDEAEEVIGAYTDGFARTHRGALLVNELNDVARLLFLAMTRVADAPNQGETAWL